MKHLFRSLAIGAIALTALTGCSNGATAPADPSAAASDPAAALPERITAAGVLRIGSPTTNPPYIYQDDKGQVIGLIPALAEEAGSRMGVKIEIVDTAFSSLIPALQAQRIDVIWSLMSVSDERKQVISFVDYLQTARGFLVAEGNPKGIGDFTTLCGVRLGVLRGESALPQIEKASADCAAAGKPEITISQYDDAGAGRTQVQSGNADAWLGNLGPLQYISEQVDGGATFDVADYHFSDVPFGIGFSKSEPELGAALQAVLVEMKQDGTYDRILEENGSKADSIALEDIKIEG